MSKLHRNYAAGVVALVLGLSAGSIAVNAHQNEADSLELLDPVRCEILTSSSGRSLELESLFHTDSAVNGTYMFKIASSGRSGSSNIQQGGSFEAAADETVTLGRMMLGNAGATYSVSLSVNANGRHFECFESIET